MGSPIQTVAQYMMIHVRETTTKVYVHDLKPEEYQLLMSFPDYYISEDYPSNSHPAQTEYWNVILLGMT